MPPYHLSSTSRALYRVFIAPNLTRASLPIRCPPSTTPASLPQVRAFAQSPIYQAKYTKDTRRHGVSDHYTIDSAITAPRVNLVDLEGRFHPDIGISDARRKLNQVTHHLLQVSANKSGRDDGEEEDEQPVDTYDPSNPFAFTNPSLLPTVRIVSKMDLRAQLEKKLAIERKQTKGKGPTSKNMELNWAIAGGDLKHRLAKLQRFLEEGKKVEVLLGPKEEGKQATEAEANGLLKSLRDAVGEVKGTKEEKVEGSVGGVMTLFFVGPQGAKKEGEREGEEDVEEGREKVGKDRNERRAEKLEKKKAMAG